MNELPDTVEALQAKKTENAVPLGFWVLFFGLIAWGVYYTWAYTPSLGGWSQSKAFDESVQGPAAAAGDAGANIFSTILFTVLPTLAAIGLYLAARRRKAGKG
jgi:hypothetical protein